TPLFTRFSTVAGGAGSVDTPRDVRGFAVKFYTQEGNWDLVGNNIPVFFIQDAIKFPDLVHSVKMEAQTGYPQAASAHDTFWDFISLMPESTHMIMWAMSDRTIPRSLRTMEGFGIHTFRLVNAKGKSTFVKFHWKPKQGVASTIWDEAVKIAGADPDFHRRDLFEAIDRGDFPEWELGIQAFDQALADSLPFDVLDPTKIIPEEVLPVRMIGRMVLDRYPDNFFAETEQVAFCPANIVPGVDFTNDPLLQGRLFSYLDTQKSRLGTANFHQLPINAPKCPVMNFQRDGQMQMNVPKGRANYEPNSLGDTGEETGPRECPMTGFTSFATSSGEDEQGDKLRIRPESFADHYSQARMFFRSIDPAEQAHLASALVFELSKVGLEHVRTRMLSNLVNVDADLAKRVGAGLAMAVPKASKTGVPAQDLDPSPALRLVRGPRALETLKGRSVGILIADGSDAKLVDQLKQQVGDAGGRAVIIAPKVGGAKMADGSMMKADAQLAGAPSVLWDAVAIALSADGTAALLKEGAAVQFVMDAFGHLKAIGHTPEAKPLLDKAGVSPDEGVVPLDKGFVAAAGKRYWDREHNVRTLA
ncbi:MAG: catalase, partial [Sphingomonas sp.]